MCSIDQIRRYSSADQGYQELLGDLAATITETANQNNVILTVIPCSTHQVDFEFLGKRGRLKLETVPISDHPTGHVTFHTVDEDESTAKQIGELWFDELGNVYLTAPYRCGISLTEDGPPVFRHVIGPFCP